MSLLLLESILATVETKDLPAGARLIEFPTAALPSGVGISMDLPTGVEIIPEFPPQEAGKFWLEFPIPIEETVEFPQIIEETVDFEE